MPRVVMLESVIMRWADEPGGNPRNHCPEIGVEYEVPEAVLKTLQREWFTRVPTARGASRDSSDFPEPHLAKRVR